MEKTTKDLIDALAHGPVQRYIREHEYQDLKEIILKNKELFGIPTAKLIEQIATRRKAREKLPLYYRTPGILYPPPANFEQSSSEATAVWKVQIMEENIGAANGSGVDLTGGFGVDSYFLSRKFSIIHYVEPDSSLLHLAEHNHRLLGATNITYHGQSAEEFLNASKDTFDFIYVDPSRRTVDNKKVHAFEQSRPDIISLQAELFRRTSIVMVKASPLLDLQAGLSQLHFVRSVYVVSVDNECKEVLFFSHRDWEGEAGIIAVNIVEGKREERFPFTFAGERSERVTFSDPLAYLYEPNASIMKAGAFRSVAAAFGLNKIAVHTHLYTSDRLLDSFPGRTFRVESIVKPDPRAMRAFFPDGKANVAVRNYPLSAEALKKKTGLKDGGDKFLLGFSGEKKKFVVVAQRM